MTRSNAPPSSGVGAILGQSNEYAVVALSADGRITGWYGAASRLFGHREEEIIGRPFSVLFTEADIEKGIPEVELELARHNGRSEDDRWHARSDGSRFWSHGIVNRHDGPGAKLVGFVKVLRDRTDIRIREEALRNRAERLTQQLSEQRNALRMLVHELRNSMAPMVNAAHVVASEADAELRARMHAVIARQIEVMQRVLQEAVEGQSRQAEALRVEPVVMQDALRSVIDALGPDARAKEQSLVLVCPEVPLTIEVDPPRLQQMVLNLLSNAIKYTPPHGHIAVSGGIEGDMAVIRVEDDGSGIAHENLERVFDLFTRESDQDLVPGLGIGLAVVKRLAWLHGGLVQARSPGKGKGSQFALQLPLQQLPHARAADGDQ
ncbi:MAG: PAS domain S-box protein [Burkholderiaceae bacterium]|nr:PAS domain S-box protein [Burkholderiaceae bacterium]